MKDITKNEGTKNKGSTTNKIRKLQHQYEKILVDLFDQFAAESIEEALEKNEGSFGENIQDIVQCALDCLKTRVMKDLGINDTTSKIDIAIGGIGDGTDGMGIMSAEGETDGDDEPEAGESEAHEAGESAEFEAGEDEEKKEKEEKKDEELGESNESQKRDKVISANRRTDQVLLTEAYANVYRK